MREQCRGNPEYLDFLITADPQEDLSKVVRPRREPLLQEYPTHQGPRWFWATFSRDQLDLNFKNPDVLLEVINVLLFYASKGAQMLRLDAIAYLWKEPATSCIHLPQTHEVVKLIRDVMDEVYPNLLLLTETNVPHDENVSYFGEGGDEAQVIYNFSLPPLILHTVHTGNASKLTVWAQSIKSYGESTTYLNFTASHDGVGFRPTEGILTEDERQALLDITKKHGGKVSVKGNSDGTTTPYELNITYFDAVNDPRGGDSEDVQVAKFLLSQAIPLSFMGIPAVYIHSLLGSRNWYEGVDITGMPRSINRQKLDYDKLSAQAPNADNIRHRVLSEYSKMIKVRKSIPAFHPNADQEVL
jgi:sucrose phosphorylase